MWLGGHGAVAALHAATAAAALLVQELPRHLEAGRRQEPVALPVQVDQHELHNITLSKISIGMLFTNYPRSSQDAGFTQPFCRR